MAKEFKPETLCVQAGWNPKKGEPRVIGGSPFVCLSNRIRNALDRSRPNHFDRIPENDFQSIHSQYYNSTVHDRQ